MFLPNKRSFFFKNRQERLPPGQASPQRLSFIRIVFLLLFSLIFIRTAIIQIFPTSSIALSKMASKQYNRSIELNAPRGTIFDHRKIPLAMSIQKPSLAINPRIFKATNKQVVNLAQTLDLPITKIKKIQKKTNYFAWLKRKVSFETLDKVKSFALPGVYHLLEPARFYPGQTDGAQLLGFVGVDHTGLFGLEKFLDEELSGTPINIERRRDAKGQAIHFNTDSSTPLSTGLNVILTIDHVIQEITEKALDKQFIASEAKAAFAIVLDPHTGRILAVSNKPAFNPNLPKQLSMDTTKNLAFNLLSEPGSTVKPLVIAAALEQQVVSLEQIHDCEKNGRLQIDWKNSIHDDHPHETLSTKDIIVFSSNICTFRVAEKIGPENLYKTFKKFGIASKNPIIGLAGEQSGSLSHWEKWRKIRFANLAFGQGLLTTGLEMVRAYSVFANGGNMVSPYLIERIETATGEILQGPPLETRKNILSPHTADMMKQVLLEVVTRGTGKKAQTKLFTTAGKTGTAEKYDPKTNSYSPTLRSASFIGFTPALDPHLVIYVVIDEPRKKPYYGGVWAAPVFKDIATEVLKYLNVAPDKPLASQDTKNDIVFDSSTH